MKRIGSTQPSFQTMNFPGKYNKRKMTRTIWITASMIGILSDWENRSRQFSFQEALVVPNKSTNLTRAGVALKTKNLR
jgi:hypothetical protein